MAVETKEEYLSRVDIEKILYINKIPLNKIFFRDYPKLIPNTRKFNSFWNKESEKCIDGFWVSHCGLHKYVPALIYWYGQYCSIDFKEAGSKIRKIDRPTVRDIEWMYYFALTVCKGFSGFSGDHEFTGLDVVKEIEDLKASGKKLDESVIIPKEAYYKGKLKTYKHPLDILWDYYSKDMGTPLFQNEAKNLIDVGARGTGKSFRQEGSCTHNTTWDGAFTFKEYSEAAVTDSPLKTETFVGAGNSYYSSQLINKCLESLKHMPPGNYVVGGMSYEHPFTKPYKGNLKKPSMVPATQFRDVFKNGKWVEMGSGSLWHHRTFKDNAYAANSSRGSLNFIDEVGFMPNLKASLGQMKECTMNGDVKTGVICMSGTGGDMEGGATLQAMSVFRNPEAFQCLGFPDHYEQTGKLIGLFFPCWLGFNSYKDELGNTDYNRAIAKVFADRRKLRSAGNKEAYDDEICQRPVFPSEVFLDVRGNIFPTGDLREREMNVLSSTDPKDTPAVGWMEMDGDGNAVFKPDIKCEREVCSYPVDPTRDNTGAVQIWEHPIPNVSAGLYCAGIDPYDHDQTAGSVSLGSIVIMKLAKVGFSAHDEIVAEYSGRPEKADDFYEQCRLLGLYYNMTGSMLYENEKLGIKTYFDHKRSLYLMASTPGILRANADSRTAAVRQIGQHMSTKVKAECEGEGNTWLKEAAGDGKRNLDYIRCLGLLKELITYNKDGNFDRVIAFILCVIQRNEMYHIEVEKTSENEVFDDFFSRSLF